jgi:trk system potassium uptake protein TrkA
MPRSAREKKVLRVTVIGLGRFGRSVAGSLAELGYEVTAIDLDERRVEEASEVVSLATQGDGTDEDLLRSLQVERSDVAIVAQGSQIEASVLAPLILKRLGVPWVVAKATNELHGEVLRRVGADRVIYPERDAGIRLAHTLAVPRVDDYISISPTSGVAKFLAPPNLVGRTLAEVQRSCGAQLGIVAVKRGQYLITTPALDEKIQDRDVLVVIGPDPEIEAFVESGQPESRP